MRQPLQDIAQRWNGFHTRFILGLLWVFLSYGGLSAQTVNLNFTAPICQGSSVTAQYSETNPGTSGQVWNITYTLQPAGTVISTVQVAPGNQSPAVQVPTLIAGTYQVRAEVINLADGSTASPTATSASFTILPRMVTTSLPGGAPNAYCIGDNFTANYTTQCVPDGSLLELVISTTSDFSANVFQLNQVFSSGNSGSISGTIPTSLLTNGVIPDNNATFFFGVRGGQATPNSPLSVTVYRPVVQTEANLSDGTSSGPGLSPGDATFCAGEEINVISNFDGSPDTELIRCLSAVPGYTGNLVVRMSDVGGAFTASSPIIGSRPFPSSPVSSGSNESITGTIPANLSVGGEYRFRIEAEGAPNYFTPGNPAGPTEGVNQTALYMVQAAALTTGAAVENEMGNVSTQFCESDEITLSYEQSCLDFQPTASGGMIELEVIMSNSSGSFANNTSNLGSQMVSTSDDMGEITVTIDPTVPIPSPNGGTYRFRIQTTDGFFTPGSQTDPVMVAPPVLNTTGVQNPPVFFCAGDEITLLYDERCLRSFAGTENIDLQVRMSNASGSFASGTTLLEVTNGGSITSGFALTTGNTITANLVAASGSTFPTVPDFESGTNYQFRVEIANATGMGSFTDFDNTGYEVRSLLIDDASAFDAQTLCQRDQRTIAFSSGDNYPAGSEIRAIISQPDGTFFPPNDPRNRVVGRYIWPVNTLTPGSQSMTITIPYNMPPGNMYKIRLESTDNTIAGCEYGDFTIVSVRFSDLSPPFTGLQDDLSACFGGNASFNVNAASGSAEWFQLCTQDPWRTSAVGLNSTKVNDIVSIGGGVFAVATAEGLARGNNGSGYTPYDNLNSGNYAELAFGNGRLYTADGNRLLVSGSAVQNTGFTQRFPGTSQITDIVISGGVIYLASTTGIYVNGNADGSGGWTIFDQGTSYSSIWVTGTGNDRVFYGGTFNGLRITRFINGAWVTEERDMMNTQNLNYSVGLSPSSAVTDVQVDGAGIIYLATSAGVAISTDGGYSFITYAEGLITYAEALPGSTLVNEILIDGERIYASVPGGIALTHKGGGRFTVYNQFDGVGFGSPATAALALNGSTLAAAAVGGIAQATFDAPTSLGSNTVSNIDYSDTNCRYYARVTNGACVALTGFARINPIPGPITVEPVLTEFGEEISLCDGVTGQIKVSGLIPGVSYTLLRPTNAMEGMPGNGAPVQPTVMEGDAYFNGSFLISGLSEGLYGIQVQSQFGGGCVSQDFDDPDDPSTTDPIAYVELNDPDRPDPPVIQDVLPLQICLGDRAVFTLDPLTRMTEPTDIPQVNERYRWFTSFTTVDGLDLGDTPASPSESSPNGNNPVLYEVDGFPTSDATLYVAKYDIVTQCISEVVPAAYEIQDPPSLTKGGIAQPAAAGGTGTITINVSGLQAGVNYEVRYDFTAAGGSGITPMTQAYSGGSITITGPEGEYQNIRLVALATGDPGCDSDAIPSCIIAVPQDPVDDSFVPEASSMAMNMGSEGAYLQNAITAGCATDVFRPSGGIAVGRIRNPQNPAVVLDSQQVEMRGYVQFDLATFGIPENAIIDKVEYQPVAASGGTHNVCGADPNGTPVQSVTGDVQFDVTQVNPLIINPVYSEASWTDLGDVKYADFTIAKDATGAWTDLGPDAVADLEQRLINGQNFQVGLRLSGNDFDLAFYQFHGIVFADEGSHKLRITYHERDYGDLPEAKYATDANGGFEGPSHRLGSVDDDPSPTVEVLRNPALFIGTTPPDAERTPNDNANADGDDDTMGNTIPDDEDIAYSPNGDPTPGNPAGNNNFINTTTGNILVAGNTIAVNVPYTNNLTSVPGQLSIYFDWNDNGVFENDTERYTTSLGNGTGVHTFNIDIPFDAANAEIGVRLRFTTADIDAYGAAPNGEVEDLLVRVYSFDYGDLPDATDPTDPITNSAGDYNTIWTIDGLRGPRALIDNRLSIGNLTDAEGNGQPEANAFGDDINGLDDEDGIIPPDTIRRDEPATFYVFVKNLIPDPDPNDDAAASAYLVGYVDWNDDGDFEDDFEQSALIPVNASGQFEVTFTVPPTPIPLPDRVAARFRLSNSSIIASSAIGPGEADLTSVGEIEDLFVNIVAYDWGDLPEPKFATDTEGGYPGPSHKIVANLDIDPTGAPALYFGNTAPDAEKNGQPTAMADGDDQEVNQPGIVRVDDEDLEQIGLYFKNQDPFKMVADNVPALLESGDNVILELPVTNNTGRDAYLTAYFDWNNNGLFEGATESYRITIDQVGTNDYAIPFMIPDYTPTALIGVRVRLSTLETIDAYGPAPDGEVEDFLIDVKQFDYGDLPDNDSPTTMGALTERGDYHTFYSLDGSRGPRHIINEDLSIGTTVDAEGNGQSQVNAFGDDINGIDDEDGIITPDTIIRDKPAIFYVFVKNLLDRPAYLRGFVDWNDNGDFEDDPTYEKSEIIEIPVGASGYYEVAFTVPPMPVPLPDWVGARFRLSDSEGAVTLSTGPASPSNIPPGIDVIGEVHDLFVPIAGFDWGDLPEPQYITDREGGFPGPSHKIVYIELDRLTQAQIDANPEGIPNLQIGATPPDAENEGIPTEKADGDDEEVDDPISEAGDRVDDEDLSFLNFVRPGTMMTDSIVAGEPIELLIPVANYTERDANLLVFVDWNGDGDFEDEEETKWTTVTPILPLADPVDYRVGFDIPMRGEADSIGVRVRLTTGEFFDPYGQAPDGEVEDFLVELKGVDFGDLPDLTAGVGSNDFQTYREYNGPRHAVPVTPLIYMGEEIDTEVNATPTANSDGDDQDELVNDEDAIIFLTPLIPGEQAQISYSYVNNTPNAGQLIMWADWENDGELDLVTDGTTNPLINIPAGPGSIVPNSARNIYTFEVPETATFQDGNAYFRFRITSDQEFLNQPGAPWPDSLALNGEVEDYFVPVFQVGNLVWEDRNNNGFQDPEEINLGIDSVRIILRFGGVDPNTGRLDSLNQDTSVLIKEPKATLASGVDGDLIDDFVFETYSANGGIYGIAGNIEGYYQIVAIDTFNLTPTRPDWIDNVTEEDRDSDGIPYKEPWEYEDYPGNPYVAGDMMPFDIRQSRSQVFFMNRDSIGTDEEGILDQRNPGLLAPNSLANYPDNRVEQRIDFGYTAFDFGDLDSNYVTVEDETILIANEVTGLFPLDTVKIANPTEGPKHIVTPDVYLGACSDAEQIGNPDFDAGAEFALEPVNDYCEEVADAADGLGDDPIDSGWNSTDRSDTLSCSDDENGIKFMTPLIPGYEAIIDLNFFATINDDGPDAFLQAFIDWNGDGDFYVDGDAANGFDPNEQIIFTHLNGDTLLLEPNTLAVELEMSEFIENDSIRLMFNVPADAKYSDGNMLARFRIGKDPNMGATGILPGNENFPDGIVPQGEVEDYFMKLSKVGNIVWEDRDYDGIQDIDEPGIPGVKITLDFFGIDTELNGDFFEKQYETVTDADGKYYFCGLIGNVDPSGIETPTYRLTAEDPDNMTPTVNRDPEPCVAYNSDGNDDDIDDRITAIDFMIEDPMGLCTGEADPVGKLDMTQTLVMDMDDDPNNFSLADNVWPDCQMDETLDFGYVGFDYGDLPDTSSTATDEYDYITLRDWLPGDPNYMGPRHAIQPKLYLGDGVDGELNGQPDLDAGSKEGGDDDFMGEDMEPFTQGNVTDGEDENGIRLLTPLLPGEYAFIRVDYTSQDTVLAGNYADRTAFLNAFIDWNGDGDFYDGANIDAGEAIEFEYESFTTLEDGQVDAIATPGVNGELPGGEDLYKIFGFRVPDTLTAQFYDGTAFMRFRLSWTGDLDPDNRRYHKATDAQVILDNEPASAFLPVPPNTIPQQVDALSWLWADTLQTYPQGEVEDYAIPLAKIGNLAWYDHNVNGRQDGTLEDLYNTYVDEYGVDTLHLVLIWGGVDNATGDFDAVGYQDTDLASAGAVFDIRYNLSIAPEDLGIYSPTDTIKTNSQGLYSFRGLIPGNYNLIPLKYLQTDSTSFVNFWPKHRVLTVKNNVEVSDSLDSDAGPGVAFTIQDYNLRDPEVGVDSLPLNEDGQLDATDLATMNMGWGITDYNPFFPDSLYDQTIDLGWVDEPNIEASLDLVGVDFPTTETCGNFNVIYHLCLKNPTETPLDSIVPFLNIAAGYGDAFVRGTAEVSIVEQGYLAKWVADSLGVDNYEEQQIAMEGSVGDLTPYINSSYTGEGADTFLLTGGDVDSRFYLPGDSVICIRIEFEVNPEIYAQEKANGVDCPWMLRGGSYARAVGFTYDASVTEPWLGGDTKVGLIDWMPRDGNGDPNPRFGLPIEVYDLSDEFDDPAFNEADGKMAADSIQFEGYVVDRGDVGEYKLFDIFSRTGRDKYEDEDDYVVQNDECWEKTKNPSVNGNIILGLDENCGIKLDARNFVNDYEEECGFDTYPEGSYYRVVIKDEHTGEVLWASVDRLPFEASQYLDRKLIFEVRTVADFCTVTWGRITIEDKLPPVVTCAEDIDKEDTNNMLLNVTAPLVCTDIDSVLNNPRSYLDSTYAYFTGIATAVDNCRGEVIFDGANDVLQVFADCEVSAANGYAYAKITRTFLFRDTYGNKANCEQEIYFYRPQIILPDCEVTLYRYDVGEDRELSPEDLVNKYGQSEAVPYIINAAGDVVYLTDETICGFGIHWENESTFVSDECTFKIVREWRIFDWCYSDDVDYPDYLDRDTNDGSCYDDASREGNVYVFKQLLKVEDRVAPIVRIPDFDGDGNQSVNGYKGGPDAEPTVSTATYDADDVYEFSTQGTDCLANFSVTKDMFEVEEEGAWCFDLEDIVVRQPVLDLDDRPIEGEFEIVVDELAQISGDCEGGYWVDEVRMRLDTSEHYLLQMRFYDECGNDTLIYAPFEVIDDVKPVVICDDDLRVTFDNFGTANLSAADVDEGTYDNCGKIVWLKVRRPVLDCGDGYRSMLSYVDANNNSIIDEADYIDENDNNRADSLEYFRYNEEGELMSPLLDKVHFFCCDADSVKVELWASDKFGNVSNCWQYARLENKPLLDYTLPDNYILPNDRELHCEEEEDQVALLKQAGTYAEGSLSYRAAVALLGGDIFIDAAGGCLGFSKEIEVSSSFDQCGFGQIEIYWILSSGEEELITDSRFITVVERHHYWIKFPKDVYTNCVTPLVDSVAVETSGCDLMAISTLPDERFETPQDPNSCYKLLRTYRVINWCEYDGESQPVVVSRDWDAHNGTDCGEATGAYNANPEEPDGDDEPGDEDIYVIVDIDNTADGSAIVYYDNDADPFNTSTADLEGDDNNAIDEGYWWSVIRPGSNIDLDCMSLPNVWNGAGTNSQDADDNRYGSFGFWQYTQHIVVYDEIDPELTVVSQDTFYSLDAVTCSAPVQLSISSEDLCNGFSTNVELQVVIDGVDASDGLVAGQFSGRYSEGPHDLIITAKDACGNVAVYTQTFVVADGKAPAPIVHEDLVAELSELDVDGETVVQAEVWASDFVASDIYDCNGQDATQTDANGNALVTKYSINVVGDSVDMNQTGLVFTCADANQIVDVEIHAWDEAGNHDFVVTSVLVQDNNGLCDVAAGTGQISGGIATEENARVNEVEVRLSGADQRSYLTNATGTYSFTELQEQGDFTVIPSKDDYHENGISTFDVVLLQKHIVGSDQLESPYKQIAADVNRSGTITTLDLILLRKIVLGIDMRFTDNTSWRFVDADFRFRDGLSALTQAFPEVKNINNLSGSEEANFFAVKTGDLNASASAYVQPRSQDVLRIEASGVNRQLQAGQEYRIDFRSSELSKVQGYQFTLELGAGIELVDMIYAQAQAEHFGVFTERGVITTSWNGKAQGDDLFSLVIRPDAAVMLEDVVRISSHYTAAEAYNASDEIMDVQLGWSTPVELVNSSALYQNEPNPFTGETQISFRLAEAERASIRIRDVQGRLVLQSEGDYAAGVHELRIKRSDLPSAGVYYYTLQAGDFIATKKMILLE